MLWNPPSKPWNEFCTCCAACVKTVSCPSEMTPSDSLNSDIQKCRRARNDRQRSPAEPGQVAPNQQAARLRVVVLRDVVVPIDEVIAQRVKLDLFVEGVGGQHIREIRHHAPGGRQASHLLESPPAIARAGDERRDRRQQRGGRDPGRQREQQSDHGGECDQRACESENGRDHLDRPIGGFTLRLLQLIVIGGVFEVGQVERVRMPHDEFLDVDSQLFLQELLVDVAQRLEE